MSAVRRPFQSKTLPVDGGSRLGSRYVDPFASLRLLAVTLLLACAQPAYAYRPFDSTDAAVAGPGEFELELGPLGRLREGSKKHRVAPAAIANYGFSDDRELVIEGQREVALYRGAGEPASSIVDDGIFIKQVKACGPRGPQTKPFRSSAWG